MTACLPRRGSRVVGPSPLDATTFARSRTRCRERTVTAGLAAGLFFAYACSVMLALHRVDDRAFVAVMQQINDAIQNPAFFAVLFGAPVLIVMAGVQRRGYGNDKAVLWIWGALALYVVGLLVTIAANVPLNDDLAAAGDLDRIKDLAGVRDHFEGPWNAWNIVRTILHTAALGCLAAGANSPSLVAARRASSARPLTPVPAAA